MSKMNKLLKPIDIETAVKKFASIKLDANNMPVLVGLTQKSRDVQLLVFSLLDLNHSRFLEEEDVRHMLQSFSPGARELTDQETKDFLSAGGEKGKISADDFIAMIAKAK
ncbi:parvalbumin-7-like [Ranitomeya variabilis]|uniref:parvalbumin-7-like n=1 Tax=Ranitomeya variabilis TaxID=490064 RepID=UPI004056D383